MFWRKKSTPIMDAPHNQPVRVRGVVAAVDAPLVTPLTGRACVHYRLEVQHEIGRDMFRRDTVAASDFAVEDSSGRALVRGDGVTIKALGQDYIPYSRHEEADRALAGRLEELGVLKRDRNDLVRDLTIYEIAILVGDEVELRGRLTRGNDEPVFEACELRCKRDEGVTIPAAID